MSERPRRIDQIIPSIVEYDAVSNHTFGVQRVLREMGFDSTIYAQVLGPGVEGRVQPLEQFIDEGDSGRWVMYQCSIGSPAAEIFAAYSQHKMLDYHNITPAELVERWLPPLGEETRLGRRQLAELAPIVHFAIADSAFNASELVELGYQHAEVVSVLIAEGNLIEAPDREVLARFVEREGTDWLFVGQIAPHKAQHDLIMAFSRYRALFDPNARLHIVGREMGNAYRAALVRLIHHLHLEDCITLAGSVSSAELAAYYQLADVFVCLSDHEGFCAPLVEAMSRGLLVVANAAAAVPGTVLDGAVLLQDKSPDLVASVVHELLLDGSLSEELRRRGRRRAATLTLAAAEDALRGAITRAIALNG